MAFSIVIWPRSPTVLGIIRASVLIHIVDVQSYPLHRASREALETDLLRQRPPGLPQQDREADQDHRDRGEGHADLDDLVGHDEVRREVGEDLVELAGVLREVVLPAGRLGDGHQRLLVDRPAEAAATAAEATAAEARVEPLLTAVAGLVADVLRPAAWGPPPGILRPEADREDPNAPSGRLLRGLDRLRAGIA